MRVVTILGARPQFVKAGALSRAYRQGDIEELIVHTGQHYDAGMSDVFFEELQIPAPWRHLGIGSHGAPVQTGRMLEALDPVLREAEPAVVVVSGDTNSTLAGALAAAQLDMPVAHVEAGLRSFNRHMPEERNRVVTDHLSDLLFAPSQRAMNWLSDEGIVEGVVLAGDVMRDVLEWQMAQAGADARGSHSGGGANRVIATIHRPRNTDNPARLHSILDALAALAADGLNIVLPLHPRTRERLAGWRGVGIDIIEPIPHRHLLRLMASARAVVTDSGGIQKEAYWLSVPCITLRAETEWIETVEEGWNVLVDADPEALMAAVMQPPFGSVERGAYGSVGSATRIAEHLLDYVALPARQQGQAT